jgi:hypothetical protein
MLRRWLMTYLVLFGASICLVSPHVAESALIVGYSGTDPSVPQTGAGVTNAGISRSSGVTAGNPGTVYETKSWTTGATPDFGDYVEFGWTASPTYGFDLDTLEIQYGRTGNGPTKLIIQMKRNSDPFVTIHTDASVELSFDEYNVIDLTAYNQVTSAIFRVFAYNANNASGQLDITNFEPGFGIRVGGVTATPEPTSIAVFGLGAVAAGYVGWRRRKATLAQKA